MGEEDFFSDDDFDAIPDNTLQELERNAWSSTQRAKPVTIPSRPVTANKNIPWRPPQPQKRPQTLPPARVQALNAPPSSDYGFDEEDVIDLDEPSMVIEPTSSLHARPKPAANPKGTRILAVPQTHHDVASDLDAETEAAYAAADAELGAKQPDQWTHAPYLRPKSNDGVDVSSLQARIAELEAEQTRLQQAEQQARNAALAKQGEIAIVRANQDKAAKEYERRMAVMQKLHADDAAKIKAELEAGKKEREKMQTDHQFLQHDLAHEDRSKRSNGTAKARAAALAIRERESTPRKAKRTGLGDGFDNVDELRTKSPIRSREKTAKDQTPKLGAKRKRTANDSPIAALSFTQPSGELARADSGEVALASFQGQANGVSDGVENDERYEFMQRLLRHSPAEGHDVSMEALARYAFRSEPRRSLVAILLDDLARQSPLPAATAAHEIRSADDFSLRLARALLDLWNRCLTLHFFQPLSHILDLLNFALFQSLAPAIASLIETALPLCTQTIDLITIPVARASVNPAFAATLDRAAQRTLEDEIDVEAIMGFVLQLAQAATLSPDAPTAILVAIFWKLLGFRFMLLMLNKAQPVSQILRALAVLELSALPGSFGPICAEGAVVQGEQEVGLVDRLTSLLSEAPEIPADEDAYSEEEVAELRIGILDVLRKMCLTDHGGLLLAQHRYAVGRLVRFLHGQVEKLYRLPPLIPTQAVAETTNGPHDLVITSINTTVLLLYHLLRTHEDIIDFTQKLNAVQGGHRKFLIAMSRVAFTEGVVFERGIREEVVEAAHAILDNLLSPEEGEAVVRAVETPRGTRGWIGEGEG